MVGGSEIEVRTVSAVESSWQRKVVLSLIV